MATVVCPFMNCPYHNPNKFCNSDTIILELSSGNLIQCRTGLIAAYERSQQDGVQRTTEGSEVGNKECENNES